MGDGKFSFSLGGVKGGNVKGGSVPGASAARGKPPPPVFEASSDDEEAEIASKRQRVGCPATTDANSLEDPEVLKVIEKLAEFVAKNGRSLEDLTRERNSEEGPFRFLFDRSCREYVYYDCRVRAIEKELSVTERADDPQPPRPPQRPEAPARASRSEESRASRSQEPGRTPSVSQERDEKVPVNTVLGGVEDPVKQKAVAALQQGDSLAAMEAFARLAAKHEETRPEAEAKVHHLNETSFDRRRQLAVYKRDGSRGHHMQDFIPPEELAKVLSKGKSSVAKAQSEALEEASKIKEDNIGHRLLQKMGWKEGEGLGTRGDGIAAPIAASGSARDNLGLGAKAHGEIDEDDDEYQSYRKRMMLGYKHRPNPLGNPRKKYY
eukprot:jgi/Botrbrau1/19409/Bobra.0338s0036.1